MADSADHPDLHRSTNEFLSGIEKEVRERDRDRDRDRSSRRSGRSDYYDDERRSSGRRHRDEPDDYEQDRERRRRGGSGRDRDYDRRRDDDYYSRSSRSRRDDGYSRPRYDDEDGYYGGGRRSGRGGGRGDWRNAGPRDISPARRRSPTPEGTIPLSERPRPNSKWDIAAPGFEGTSASAAKATGLFGIPGQSRTLGIPPAPISMGAGGAPGGMSMPSSLPPIHMGAAGSAAAATAAAAAAMGGADRQSRRLYIGNITYEASEANLCAFFNAKMRELKLTSGDSEPCLGAQVNPDKGYAFLEFRTPDEATNAMSFDGIVFQSQSLKIRRPKDYVGPDVRPDASVHVPGVISTNVPDSPNKIFIGGLPTYLTDEQVIELLQAFGELRAFNLVKEAGTNASKGFAFCEYVDPALTDLACQGLNDMELGDRKLVVQRASIGSERKQGAMATGANAGVGIAVAAAAAAGADSGDPTSCMVMLNMVTAAELQDDEEYADIVEDIRDECRKYGTVTDVRIPRPARESKGAAAHSWKQATADQTKEREGVGRVYVRYEKVDECAAALRAIAGRQFGGHLVICAFLKEDEWPGDEDGGQNAQDTAAQASGPAFALATDQ